MNDDDKPLTRETLDAAEADVMATCDRLFLELPSLVMREVPAGLPPNELAYLVEECHRELSAERERLMAKLQALRDRFPVTHDVGPQPKLGALATLTEAIEKTLACFDDAMSRRRDDEFIRAIEQGRPIEEAETVREFLREADRDARAELVVRVTQIWKELH